MFLTLLHFLLTAFGYFTDRCFNYARMRCTRISFASSALYNDKVFYSLFSSNGTLPAQFLSLNGVTLNLSCIYSEVLCLLCNLVVFVVYTFFQHSCLKALL